MTKHGLQYTQNITAKDGGIDGYRAVCLCGFEVRDSLSCDNVKADLAAHANWMAENAPAPTWDSLRAFVGQRVRLEGCNYSDAAAYRADRKRIDQDRADARALIDIAEAAGIDPESVPARRLAWDAATGWDYTLGQYYPTEVFGAVCEAVSAAIWGTTADRLRDQMHEEGWRLTRDDIVREARSLAPDAKAQKAVTRWIV